MSAHSHLQFRLREARRWLRYTKDVIACVNLSRLNLVHITHQKYLWRINRQLRFREIFYIPCYDYLGTGQSRRFMLYGILKIRKR